MSTTDTSNRNSTAIDRAVVKFAGDSGDGMQLVGSLFTDTTVFMGNDIATFPDFPSEIRAPQGTVAGVSGYQIHFGRSGVHSPGDAADVLIAMNPAALKANLHNLKPGCTIIVDADAFGKKDLEKAGFSSNPLEDGTIEGYKLIAPQATSLTKAAVADLGLDNKTADRSKNMFALGVIYWLFSEPLQQTEAFFIKKFSANPELAEANIRALHAGFNYALTVEAVAGAYTVAPAAKQLGRYRNITGNQATAWGLLAAAERAGLHLFLGSYPITPATDILQEISKHKWTGARVFQAEDEISGICSAIGAAFAGNMAVTTTSGPGMALKTEALGLAVMTELPLVVVNVQRGGPSTGLPTKTEQSDLFQALYGRNGESPVVVLAASTPADCFDWAYEASRIALEHMTPVVLLTENYIANGAEPWRIKVPDEMPDITTRVITKAPEHWMPYTRDEQTLVRHWALPGTPELQHRIGGLEKDDCTGCVSHDPYNHERMVHTRRDKIKKIADLLPYQKFKGRKATKLLVVGWGGQFGILLGAVKSLQEEGYDIAFTNFNYIHPLPNNTAEIFAQFEKILVCELNMGQFAAWLRNELPQFEYMTFNKVQGLPFRLEELKEKFKEILQLA